jgi:hypothetical protein
MDRVASPKASANKRQPSQSIRDGDMVSPPPGSAAAARRSVLGQPKTVYSELKLSEQLSF